MKKSILSAQIISKMINRGNKLTGGIGASLPGSLSARPSVRPRRAGGWPRRGVPPRGQVGRGTNPTSILLEICRNILDLVTASPCSRKQGVLVNLLPDVF